MEECHACRKGRYSGSLRYPTQGKSELDRAEVVGGLRSVDYVVLFGEPTAEDLVSKVRPHIYVKGGDYTPETLPEAKIVNEYGGRVEFIPMVEGRSTTSVIEKIKQN